VPDGQVAPTTTFDYDAAGRVVRQGAKTLTYNGFDQLVEVTGAAAYAYGYEGLRVSSVTPDGKETFRFTEAITETADGTRQVDVLLGDRLIARVTRARETASAARHVQTGLAVAGLLAVLAALATRPRRRRRARLAAPAALLPLALVFAGCHLPATDSLAQASRATSGILYYHQAVGAGPSLITREDATVLDERRHEPFGAGIDSFRELPGGGTEIAAVDYARDPHNVLNQQSDPATGWSDHGARWLAPETGRWLTPDPPVKAPDPKFMTAPWALHPYQYVNQNPVLYWDPDGKQPALKEAAERVVEAAPKLTAAARAASMGWKVLEGGSEAAAAGAEAAAGALAAGAAAFAAVTFYPRTLADATCNRPGSCGASTSAPDGSNQPQPDPALRGDRERPRPRGYMMSVDTEGVRWSDDPLVGGSATRPVTVDFAMILVESKFNELTGTEGFAYRLKYGPHFAIARVMIREQLEAVQRDGGVSEEGKVVARHVIDPPGATPIMITVTNEWGHNLQPDHVPDGN
jgi:RHS repeat-associated protein